MSEPRTGPAVLVAIPAFNEARTIKSVIGGVTGAAPRFDVLVVNDGSTDDTERTLAGLEVTTVTHLCNLGYGRAVQTALKYAARHQYDAVITFDGDGQHRPEELVPLYEAFVAGSWDLLIGSRFVSTKRYDREPLARRAGMQLFSALIGLLFRCRIYDTTSGLKVIGRSIFDRLISRPFVDFHAEAIGYLLGLGCRVGEHPITVDPREHGQSMYTLTSVVAYPLQVAFLIAVGVIDVWLIGRGTGGR